MTNIKIKELEAVLMERFDGLIEGAQTDVNNWVAKIASNMVQAAATNDTESHEMMVHQLEALAARHRLRANKAAWGTMQDTVLFGIKLLTSVIV